MYGNVVENAVTFSSAGSLHFSVVFKFGIIHNSKALSLMVNFEDQMIDRIPQVHSSRIGRSLIDAVVCSTVFGFDTKSID